MIYADWAADAPVCESAREELMRCMSIPGNPSSVHAAGMAAREVTESARAKVARLIGCDADEVYFTSGGTEADNLAVIGGYEYAKNVLGREAIVTSAIEHAAVLNTVRYLEARGADVRYVAASERDSSGEPTGRVSADDFERVLDGAGVVCLMHANNETGTVQPIREVTSLARSAGAIVFCDAVQAAGHVKLDVRELGVDMLAISGHKLGSPGGIGALYVRRGITLPPILHGGGQERGLRSGTLPVALIASFGAACAEAEESLTSESAVRELRDRIAAELSRVDGAHLNGSREYALPGTLNVSFDGVGGEELVNLCSLRGLCISTGSACHSGMGVPSAVLVSMGFDEARAEGAVRISIGRGTTEDEAREIMRIVRESIELIREV